MSLLGWPDRTSWTIRKSEECLKQALEWCRAIALALQEGGEKEGLPPYSIQLVPFVDRESVKEMASMDDYLDVIIPRGGKGLIEAVVSLARMPVIKHYDGICHVFVDEAADREMALEIAIDAKTQKPSVCNALETLLVHEAVAGDFLPVLAERLAARQVELRGCPQTQAILGDRVVGAGEEDWSTEYLDYILAIKVVSSGAEAVAHINQYGSQHTDCIVTKDEASAERFLREVDSACVFHNVSTRFSDGEEFGFKFSRRLSGKARVRIGPVLLGRVRLLPGESFVPHVPPESLGLILGSGILALVFAGEAEVEGHHRNEGKADCNGKVCA